MVDSKNSKRIQSSQSKREEAKLAAAAVVIAPDADVLGDQKQEPKKEEDGL